MQSLNTFEDGGTIVGDDHFSFGSLDLNKCWNFTDRNKIDALSTILSIPLGPRDVRTASLIAG
jgi:hypothetical protein